jgi:hypothetical protein
MTKKPEPQVGEVLTDEPSLTVDFDTVAWEARHAEKAQPSLTAGDLTFERATLNADIDTIKSNRKKALDEVANCDAMLANYAGAVAVLDRLIERLNSSNAA